MAPGMRVHCVLGALALAGSAAGLRTRGPDVFCDNDEITMAKITMNACMTNWNLKKTGDFNEMMDVGCWKLKAYNTDKFLSSALYRNEQDGRCAIGFSGYHGALAGYLRGISALVWPPQTWNICGQDMYAPYVRLLRHHLNLANWSRMVNLFAGPDAICKGEPMFGAESMGGTSIEMLATCANSGRLSELQDAALPGYGIETLYSYGAPAGSMKPLTNTKREDGCFKGKRIFFARDPVAQFGSFWNLRHPRMDAVEIWPGSNTTPPSIKTFPCSSKEATLDAKHEKPPPVDTDVNFDTKMDRISHEITSYVPTIYFLEAAGHKRDFSSEPLESSPANRSTAGLVLALLQQGLA